MRAFVYFRLLFPISYPSEPPWCFQGPRVDSSGARSLRFCVAKGGKSSALAKFEIYFGYLILPSASAAALRIDLAEQM